MRLECLVVLCFLLFAVSPSEAARKDALVFGGWTPITDINDPHVKEIADFAVTEHDRQSGDKLMLDKVVKGDTQVVSGTNYRIVLAATEAGGSSAASNYEAIVWEKPWLHYMSLTSFNPVQA